jgi:ubiquitin-protein ligase
MHPVRLRRLESDFRAAQAFIAAAEGRVTMLSSTGSPPESYVFLFQCRSLLQLTPSGPVFGWQHHVRFQCSAAYPAQPPFVTMLSPLVHPHVWPNRVFCMGTWNPSQKLDSQLQRVGAILTYDPAAINLRSVADDAAATWVRSQQHALPLDRSFPSAVSVFHW